MKKSGYLPEYHSFQYRAWAPWPCINSEQQDWITAVSLVESWLETSVGPHYELWAWDRVDLAVQGHFLGVAFKRSPHRTLFVLRWGTV